MTEEITKNNIKAGDEVKCINDAASSLSKGSVYTFKKFNICNCCIFVEEDSMPWDMDRFVLFKKEPKFEISKDNNKEIATSIVKYLIKTGNVNYVAKRHKEHPAYCLLNDNAAIFNKGDLVIRFSIFEYDRSDINNEVKLIKTMPKKLEKYVADNKSFDVTYVSEIPHMDSTVKSWRVRGLFNRSFFIGDLFNGVVIIVPAHEVEALYKESIASKKEHKEIQYVAEAINDFQDISVRITKQTHTRKEFGKDGDTFVSTNGASLFSVMHPDVDGNNFFFRGSNESRDDNAIIIPVKDYPLFKEAVEEYNQYFK